MVDVVGDGRGKGGGGGPGGDFELGVNEISDSVQRKDVDERTEVEDMSDLRVCKGKERKGETYKTRVKWFSFREDCEQSDTVNLPICRLITDKSDSLLLRHRSK